MTEPDPDRTTHALDTGVSAERAVDDATRTTRGASDDVLITWAQLSLTLLNASHHTGPDETADIVRLSAEEAGLHHVGIHLSDLEQRVLRRLDGHVPSAVSDEHDVETTEAGVAYQHEVLRTERCDDGRTRLWVPLIDGIERLGVLSADVDDDTPEIRWLAVHLASFTAMVIVTKDQYGDVIRRSRRTQPISIESELRWALLPPLTSTGPSAVVAAAMAPAYGVAGDAYDYAWDHRRLHLAVFDAVGHDLHATRVANLALASYRHSRSAGLGLDHTYAAIGEHLRILYDIGDFVTGQLAVLDASTGELEWLSAGHPRPFLIRDGQRLAELFCPGSPPFGIGNQAKGVATTQLEPGDHVLFYSDGIVEALRHEGGELGADGLADVVASVMREPLPAAETVRRISRDLGLVSVQRDDATLLMVHWNGPAIEP